MSYDFIKIKGMQEIRGNLEVGHFTSFIPEEVKAFLLAHNPRASSENICFPLKKGESCFKSLEEWKEEWERMGSPMFIVEEIFGLTFSELMEIFPPEIFLTD